MGYNWTLASGLQLEYKGYEVATGLVTGVTSNSLSPGPIEMIFDDTIQFLVRDVASDSECATTKNNSFGCNGVGAASHSLHLCIQTCTAAIENGNLTERLISSWSNREHMNIHCRKRGLYIC
jgi:hypothetical protein